MGESTCRSFVGFTLVVHVDAHHVIYHIKLEDLEKKTELQFKGFGQSCIQGVTTLSTPLLRSRKMSHFPVLVGSSYSQVL